MFVNVNAHPGSKPKPLGQLGELSRARVIPSEFKYNRGTEIFGETEPADYIYQGRGRCGSHPQAPLRRPPPDRRIPPGRRHFWLENGAAHRFTAEAIV
jgi:CRP/FNR family nitrogen fixation transcriptional regulator